MTPAQDTPWTHRRRKGRYVNPSPEYYEPPLKVFLKLIRSFAKNNLTGEVPPLPLAANDPAFLKSNRTLATATWVGHSTVLLQVHGNNILTDPIWSRRAGPVRFAGSRRYTPPGLAFEDLPRVDIVLITHDHYDHLDSRAVRRLAAEHDPVFFVPLGLRRWMRRRGITNVTECGWWDAVEHDGVRLTCAPAQHFSSRGIADRYRRLWCSWAIGRKAFRAFFCGDTGYFPGFRDIGARLGPFDVAFLPIGAYLPREVMKPVHMSPAEAVKAARDLRARTMIPIHWGTYVLALDYGEMSVRELQRVVAENRPEGLTVKPMRHGETLKL
jgi:N-acyl-phosphatidylethanolamine-hydrolysing phospholipase D